MKALYALQIEVNDRKAIVGKVLEHDGKRIFYRPQYKNPMFHKWQALSFDRKVAYWLWNEVKVNEIHFAHAGKLYSCPFDYFMDNATLGEHGEGEQLYLKIWHWEEQEPYDVPWTDIVKEVTNEGNV